MDKIDLIRPYVRMYFQYIAKSNKTDEIEEKVYSFAVKTDSPSMYYNLYVSIIKFYQSELTEFVLGYYEFTEYCIFKPYIRGIIRKRFEEFTDYSRSKIIEQSCYNATIEKSKTSEDLICRRWDTIFRVIYEERCKTILELINPDSLTCQTFGTFIDASILSINDLYQIGYKSAHDLYPISFKKEDEMLAKRLNQKIVLKTSSLFPCPKCKGPSTFEEKQTRGLDEATDFYCICSLCNFKFKH